MDGLDQPAAAGLVPRVERIRASLAVVVLLPDATVRCPSFTMGERKRLARGEVRDETGMNAPPPQACLFITPAPNHEIVAFFGNPVDNRAVSAVVFQWDCS